MINRASTLAVLLTLAFVVSCGGDHDHDHDRDLDLAAPDAGALDFAARDLALADFALADLEPASDLGSASDLAVSFTLTVENSSAALGTITSSDGQVHCGTSCGPTVYAAGTNLMLTAVPTTAGDYVVWSGDCAGSAATCALSMKADHDVHATFMSGTHNYVFVSPATWNPSSGVAAADALCNSAAIAAGLPDIAANKYVAWLSTSTTSAVSRLGGARGWVRTGDSLPFADTPAALTMQHQVFYPIANDASGAASSAIVLTGTTGDGVAYLTGGVAQTCKDWTSMATTDFAGRGVPNGYALQWTDVGNLSCASPVAVYCFGTANTTPVTPPAAPGRYAFYDDTSFTANLGVAGADAACAVSATAAKLPGSYRALLATSAFTAASRFSANGAPWVRVDGVELASTAASLLSGAALLAPFDVSASGNYYGNSGAWTGAVDPMILATSTASDCTDWSSATGTGITSALTSFGAGWFNAATLPCNGAYGVFCLEQ